MPDDYYVSQYSGEEIDALLGIASAGAVRYDAAQTLTDAQKTQARNNISAMQGIESTEHPGCYYVLNGSTVEWVTPPLELGVEYRTTERYMGKPVYVKATDCGVLPTSGSIKNVVDAISNMEHLVSYGGDVYNDAGTDSLPYYGGENRRIEVDAYKNGIGLYNVGLDGTVFNVIIWRKYTKATN